MKSEWHLIENSELGTAKVEINAGMAFLHLELHKPFSGYREAKRQMPKVKEALRKGGFEHVHVIIPEGDEKLYRFERAFGFTEVRRGCGQILMRQEC